MELVKKFGSARNAWEKVAIDSSLRTRIVKEVEEEIQKVKDLGFWLSCFLNSSYPTNLSNFPAVAPVIYGLGELKIIDEQAVAVVGTRKFSQYGEEATRFFVQGLVSGQVTVVSGLMRGIDTIAHQSSLDFGGRTVAVMGSGLNVIVPLENADLYQRISKNGAVISQFPLDTQPAKFTFPVRDELIAALSKAVLVIEAPEKSGALLTAQFALDQGKEVYVVPGEIFSVQSVGCHELIKNGARLVTKPEEILEDLGLDIQTKITDQTNLDQLDLNVEEKAIFLLINEGVKEVNELVRRSGLGVGVISSSLSLMEIKGLIKQVGVGEYRLV